MSDAVVMESPAGEVHYGFSSAQESKIVLLLGVVQFINVLDFMMVMPLGPDFAKALDILPSHLGWIGGSYTAAAGISGFICSFFLDRFERRKALSISLFGLATATAFGGFAFNFESLMMARILAGVFGGPVSTLVFSMVADAIPLARRGRAMGALMSAFSVASVFGVPAGLELARIGGWRFPFYAVSTIGFIILVLGIRWLPVMTAHVERALQDRPLEATRSLLGRKNVWLAYGGISVAMAAGFLLIPNIATYFQFNLGFPRERLGSLYLIGGLISFVFMLISGRLVDKFNGTVVAAAATALLIFVTYFGYVKDPTPLPIYVIFVGFMTAMGVRSVATTAVSTRVTAAHERARFVSFLSVFQHSSAAFGAFLSATLLGVTETGQLTGMSTVAKISIGFSLFILVFLVPLERNLNRSK